MSRGKIARENCAIFSERTDPGKTLRVFFSLSVFVLRVFVRRFLYIFRIRVRQ